jgi:ATP-binding cassette subfamily B protein
MQIGDVLACTNYLLQILLSLLMASLVFKSVSQAQASVVRIFEVLDKEMSERESLVLKPKDASVKFTNVYLENFSLGKEKGKLLLSDVSFEVKDG